MFELHASVYFEFPLNSNENLDNESFRFNRVRPVVHWYSSDWWDGVSHQPSIWKFFIKKLYQSEKNIWQSITGVSSGEIQDFQDRGTPTPKWGCQPIILAKFIFWKLRKNGWDWAPGGEDASLAPPFTLDPPMVSTKIRQCIQINFGKRLKWWLPGHYNMWIYRGKVFNEFQAALSVLHELNIDVYATVSH